ncbi:MAG: glutamate racemase [Patescibacteria group bacterium]
MIGIFDSGVGGLTVLRDIHKALPEYSTIYLGDNARSPYGTKTHEQLTEFTWEGVRWLFAQGCPLVILACNSASAQALRTIQQTKLDPDSKQHVLGVLSPTVEYLAEQGYQHIGILATAATVNSEAYVRELQKFDPNLKITQQACPTWVEIVEAGQAQAPETQLQVQTDVQRLLNQAQDLDAVLLGCTHYPVLFDQVRQILPQNIELYNQGPIVAEKLIDYLKRHPEIDQQIEKKSVHQYFTTGDPINAQKAARQIAGLDPDFNQVDLSVILG